MMTNPSQKPLVAIECTAYNHEPYIRDALEGFVMQKTSFPFVAIVHDDMSTDGTAAIIREYAEKYPDIIKPILEEENQWSKRDGSLNRIIDEAISATGAKYVAICEGDDYWCDPLKLQKQVDFLESNPDYGLVHTNAYTANYKDGFKPKKMIRSNVPEGNVYRQILRDNHISTLTVMYRSEFKEIFRKEIAPLPYWDRIMWICLSKRTKFHYLPDYTSVYRVLEHSATHGKPKPLLELDIVGTQDLLDFLHRANTPENEIYEFYVQRSRRLLERSYMAKDKPRLYKYWKIITDHEKPTKKDWVLYHFGKLGVPPSVLTALEIIIRPISSLLKR